jgi:hypothetical protein
MAAEKHAGLDAVAPQHHSLDVAEKNTVIHGSDVESSQLSTPGDYDDMVDPDAGKSAEERARLVRFSSARALTSSMLTPRRTRPSSGRWTYG